MNASTRPTTTVEIRGVLCSMPLFAAWRARMLPSHRATHGRSANTPRDRVSRLRSSVAFLVESAGQSLRSPTSPRHCERSDPEDHKRRLDCGAAPLLATTAETKTGLPRRFAPRNDGGEIGALLTSLLRQRGLDGLQRVVGLAAVGASGLRHVGTAAAAFAAERL